MALSDIKTKYLQSKWEVLALVWAVKTLRQLHPQGTAHNTTRQCPIILRADVFYFLWRKEETSAERRC